MKVSILDKLPDDILKFIFDNYLDFKIKFLFLSVSKKYNKLCYIYNFSESLEQSNHFISSNGLICIILEENTHICHVELIEYIHNYILIPDKIIEFIKFLNDEDKRKFNEYFLLTKYIRLVKNEYQFKKLNDIISMPLDKFIFLWLFIILFNYIKYNNNNYMLEIMYEFIISYLFLNFLIKYIIFFIYIKNKFVMVSIYLFFLYITRYFLFHSFLVAI